jgi:HSP20 family molecular chaperone IbpA
MPMYRPLSGAGFAYPLDELRDELDRLWTSLTAAPPLHGWGVRPGSDVFPAVNVSESDDCITIEAELPGLDASDVDIAVSGEELVLKGARPEPHHPTEPATVKPMTAETGETAETAETGDPAGRGTSGQGTSGQGNGERHTAVTWHRRERGTGSFERRLTLPVAVDASRVEAKLVDGVLTITCPKAPERQPHKVTVRTG